MDLPGYGFARGDRKEIENWKRLMENYFTTRRDNIALVLVLVDAKVGPTEQDFQMMEWLRYLGIPYAVVLTKTDKANQKDIGQTLKRLKEFGVAEVVQSSSKDRKGKQQLLKVINQHLREESKLLNYRRGCNWPPVGTL